MLSRKDKEKIVAEVAQAAAAAQSVVVANYHGVNVAQMTELRAAARAAGVYLRVVKNTLARRALERTHFECVSEGLKGPLVLAFSRNEAGDAAKVIQGFVADEECDLEVTMAALPDELLDAKRLDALASLPSRDEAIAALMALMRAPAAKFARTLAEVPAKLARVLAAVQGSKS